MEMQNLEGMPLCVALEYAAYHRKEDLLSKLLANKNLSKIECPKIPMMCATLSSIIKNRESENFDKAVDILWTLYEFAPDMIPFETFGNLLIDILICKILLAMVNTCDSAILVDNILKLFTIPPFIQELGKENRSLLFNKYKTISQKLIDIVNDESQDLTLSFFELMRCDCVWVNLWTRVDSYLQKVNKEIGQPILQVFLHIEEENRKKEKICLSHNKTNPVSGADQTFSKATSCQCPAKTSPQSNDNQLKQYISSESLKEQEIEKQNQSLATSGQNNQSGLFKTCGGQESYSSSQDDVKDVDNVQSSKVDNPSGNEIGKGDETTSAIADISNAKVQENVLSEGEGSIILFDSEEMDKEDIDLGTSSSEDEKTNSCSNAFLVNQRGDDSEGNNMNEDALMKPSTRNNDVNKEITEDAETEDDDIIASSLENQGNPRSVCSIYKFKRNNVDEKITEDMTRDDSDRDDFHLSSSCVENNENRRNLDSEDSDDINETVTENMTTKDGNKNVSQNLSQNVSQNVSLNVSSNPRSAAASGCFLAVSDITREQAVDVMDQSGDEASDSSQDFMLFDRAVAGCNGGNVARMNGVKPVNEALKQTETPEDLAAKQAQKLNNHIDHDSDLHSHGEKSNPVDKIVDEECEFGERKHEEDSVHIYINSDEDIVKIFYGEKTEIYDKVGTCSQDVTAIIESSSSGERVTMDAVNNSKITRKDEPRVSVPQSPAMLNVRTSCRIKIRKERKELEKLVLKNVQHDHSYYFEIDKYIPRKEKKKSLSLSLRSRNLQRAARQRLVCKNRNMGNNNEAVDRNNTAPFTKIITPKSSSTMQNIVKPELRCSTSADDRSSVCPPSIRDQVANKTCSEKNRFSSTSESSQESAPKLTKTTNKLSVDEGCSQKTGSVNTTSSKEIGVNTDISGIPGCETYSADEATSSGSGSGFLGRSSDEESNETFIFPQRSNTERCSHAEVSSSDDFLYAESSTDGGKTAKYLGPQERKFRDSKGNSSIHRVYQKKELKRKRRKRKCPSLLLQHKRRKLVDKAETSTSSGPVFLPKRNHKLRKRCDREAVIKLLKL
ncbi:uncharacterized protein LOC114516844 [Dendronephthya gigantea]|uniref:uncharacterized protein LOC114516844 n=1 Tax=Dendronephthya gigantea TaxID=151771 RepID=UPI00106C7EEA|nr:uncharacterized protein LOC114516844 [Dendronephthya gigantea]